MAAQISSLPTPPSRQDPTSFNDRADAFLGALPTFQSEANALSTELNTRADNVQAANAAVLAATNITKWVSGTTYANGAVVWSPVNGLGYRRITASGSGTTDPSLDTTNYKQVNGTGDVSTSGNQTIAGVKTFSGSIELSTDLAIAHGGTGASDAATAFANIKQAATTTATGVVELATSAEAAAGIDSVRVITPATLFGGLNASGTAPIYAARAWVNFNGTGAVAINASGNVISITDTGVGNYTVNFIATLPDANFAAVCGPIKSTTSSQFQFVGVKTSSSVQILCYAHTSGESSSMQPIDPADVNLAVIR